MYPRGVKTVVSVEIFVSGSEFPLRDGFHFKEGVCLTARPG
jgi:hypothetical protein